MKIFFLVLMAVFLTSDTIVAAPGREKETSKSQLDMILLQMERQKDQIKAQENKNEEQQRKNEEHQRKNEELRHQVKEEQRRNNEQERQLQEFTKTIRARRNESDIVNDLKEWVRAEINGLSQCVVGTYSTEAGYLKPSGFKEWKTVSFGRTFPRTPKVVTSVSGFERYQMRLNPTGLPDPNWGLKTEARSPTTSTFTLFVQGYSTYVLRLDVSWIACA